MLVFISWSRSQSKQVALALRDWLPDVLQGVTPWVSEADIESGVNWSQAIGDKLHEASFGIICVTPENHDRPWLNFEAGAIAKSVTIAATGESGGQRLSHSCPYIVGMKATDVTGPLGQLQARQADREGTRALIGTINGAMGDACLSVDRLDRVFSTWWPQLEAKLEAIIQAPTQQAVPQRQDREILEEILGLIRNQSSLNYRSSSREGFIDIKDFDKIFYLAENFLNEGHKSEHLRKMPPAQLIDYLRTTMAAETSNITWGHEEFLFHYMMRRILGSRG